MAQGVLGIIVSRSLGTDGSRSQLISGAVNSFENYAFSAAICRARLLWLSLSGEHTVPWVHYHGGKISFGAPQVPWDPLGPMGPNLERRLGAMCPVAGSTRRTPGGPGFQVSWYMEYLWVHLC